MQIEIAGKSIFPWPSSPNLYATVLEVGLEFNFTMAVALQDRKIIVKVRKLKTLNARIKLLKMLWSFIDVQIENTGIFRPVYLHYKGKKPDVM